MWSSGTDTRPPLTSGGDKMRGGEKKLQIWVDIKNSHEPLFFKTLLKDLPYNFYITARDYPEIIGLMDIHNMRYKPVGRFYGKGKIGKAFNLGLRTAELALLTPNFDFSISHASIYSVLASKIRMKPSITISDNDFDNRINRMIYEKSTYVIVPTALNMERFKTKNLMRIDGFKEDIYIADFAPSACTKEVPYKDYVIVRPESYNAHYISMKNSVVPSLIEKLVREGINTVLLPRYPEEKEKYKSMYKNQKNLFIPDKPINGVCAAWFSKAVLTGAGTLAREAACMGVPSISFFPKAELLSVDEEMINRGWVYRTRNVEEMVQYIKSSTRRKADLSRSKKVKEELVKKIENIIEGD